MLNWFKRKEVVVHLDKVVDLYKFEVFCGDSEKQEFEVTVDRGTPSATIDAMWGTINIAAKQVAKSDRYTIKFLIRKDLSERVADDLYRWRQFEGVIETF